MDFVMYEYRKDEHQRCFLNAVNIKKNEQKKTKQQPKRKEKDEYINLRVLC